MTKDERIGGRGGESAVNSAVVSWVTGKGGKKDNLVQ
jgi:hypothetical protein